MHSESRRVAEVALVLIRHGFESLIDELDLRVLVPRIHPAPAGVPRPGPEHVRRALEELGPTFMKLGQVLSTRPDLVPPELEVELARLQDAAPPVSFPAVRQAVERALDGPLNDLFSRFDAAPIAAASLGQVHAAELPDGTEVVVKVRRPDIVQQIDADLELLQRVAHAAARSSRAARFDPVGLAREFAATLRTELDYTLEASNAEVIRQSFADDARVHIPAVVAQYTCTEVITEERVFGCKVTDLDALVARGSDLRRVARTLADAYLSMVFEHAFFHADPHPGNIFVEPGDRVAFVDFGMVGSVTPRIGRGLSAVMLALVATDAPQMIEGFLELGIAYDDVDRLALEEDLDSLLRSYSGVPLEQLRIGPMLVDVMAVVRRHALRLPSDLALLLKTVMMCEGVAAQLDPGFLLVPLLVPYASRLAGDGA